MTFIAKPRRSVWFHGLEADEPSAEQRAKQAQAMSERIGVPVAVNHIPTPAEFQMRASRVKIPEKLAEFCFTDNYERALHQKGDRLEEITGVFSNPPDAIAHPRNEQELEAVLDWCDAQGHVVIPYGGGSSVVDGVTPPDGYNSVVTIDMDQFDRVLEVDATSRAARIQAGVYGPALEDQLRPHGFTLRHFPQSFTMSTLGGWIATRSGGHYATNHTHIDEFVESARMLTPKGWWEKRRLPGEGAGPDPNRIVIGSEGILGIITEAWMRVQARPVHRATAGITFSTWEGGYEAVRRIVQAKLWPANLRILDPMLAKDSAGLDGNTTLVIVSFESAELPQDGLMRQAVDIARDAGGHIPDDEILLSGSGQPTGRGGAVGAWREAFIPSGANISFGIGMVTGTWETAITWERWPAFDAYLRAAAQQALDEICGGGTVNCRFTHVYTDGPAPYYTFAGRYRPGLTQKDWLAFKSAVSDATMKMGGTITHHHAVGRQHRPWYDIERPDTFAVALRAMKQALDPNGILNPGVLIDP